MKEIPYDKLKHYTGGYAFAELGALVATILRYPPALWAVLGAIALGIVWELVQRATGKGTVDRWDAVATAAGGASVAGRIWVYSLLPA